MACIAIYLLMNIALLHVLPMAQLAASQAPAADAAMPVLGSRGKQIILIISLVATVSTINAELLISPRILFALSRDGLLPRWMASVNAGGTPAGALLMSAVASIALVLSGSFRDPDRDQLFPGRGRCQHLGIRCLVQAEGAAAGAYTAVQSVGLSRTPLGVLLVVAGFLIASVISDIKHSLFTLTLVATQLPGLFFRGQEQGRLIVVRRFRSLTLIVKRKRSTVLRKRWTSAV